MYHIDNIKLICNDTAFEMGVLLTHIEQYAKEIRHTAVQLDRLFREGISITGEKERYMELYGWWETEFNRQPLCKNDITAEIVMKIKPSGAMEDEESYRYILQAAIFSGYANEVPAPVGGSDTKYYVLHSLEENKDILSTMQFMRNNRYRKKMN